jgi:glycosyltransferase involved in cell wall biosynthesis
MIIAHLLASPFFGGPERQMLGLARSLPTSSTSVFLTFAERGQCQALLEQVHNHGFDGFALERNAPRVRAAAREVAGHLRRIRADVQTCSGYKPDVIGWLAARQAGIPVIAVAHGWTAATLKVRLYESLDRLILRWMDAVVCVSKAQSERVRRAKVPEEKIVVIRNAIGAEAFAEPDPAYGILLKRFFPNPPKRIVAAAGRLSPEKGFDQLVEAASLVVCHDSEIGFIQFGAGPLHASLSRQIDAAGLRDRFVLAGFRPDVCRFLPHVDVMVLPSLTEGLPVVLLEAFAAGVPAVATAVGGTPEVIEDGKSGYLVPPSDPPAMARRILDVLHAEPARLAMGQEGRRRVQTDFTFADRSLRYQRLFDRLLASTPSSQSKQLDKSHGRRKQGQVLAAEVLDQGCR